MHVADQGCEVLPHWVGGVQSVALLLRIFNVLEDVWLICPQQNAGGTGVQEGIRQVRKVSVKEGLGVAVGSRAHLEAEAMSQRSWHRNLLMHGFHLVVLLVAVGGTRDTQCGFKVGDQL